MKSHMGLATAMIAAAMLATSWSGRMSFAQEEGEEPKPRGGGYGAVYVESESSADDPYGPVRNRIKLRGGEAFRIRMHGPPHDAIRKAAEAVVEARTADDEKVGDEAREKLTALLNEHFEEDMQHREQELKDVEARLEKLRSQLERRREKKDDIIDLQIQVALYDAEGLGMFNGPPGPGPRGMNMSYPPTPPWPPGQRGFDPVLPDASLQPAQPPRPARPARPAEERPRVEPPADDRTR